MKKEPKSKCKYCRARHRVSFMLHFPDKSVCLDCACEYRKMFFGFKNRDVRRLEEKYQKSKQVWDENFEKGFRVDLLSTPWPVENPFKMYSKPPEDDGISKDT